MKLWKLIETKDYATIRKSQEYIEYMATKSISEKHWQTSPSILNAYYKDSRLCDRDRFTLVADFLLAGIDTSSYTMAFLLYELAKNSQVQNDLWSEIKGLENIDENSLKNFKRNYPMVDAILQENFR